MSLDAQTIEDIAIELGVDPSFIEKDWYAVKVLKAISGFSHEAMIPIFSGGTSLSKGYGLLKRFSEDLDFRARFVGGVIPSRPAKRSFRNGILDVVKSVDGVTFDEAHMDVGSNYFKIPLAYPQQFDTPSSLRAELKLEFSYTQPRCDAVTRPVSSLETGRVIGVKGRVSRKIGYNGKYITLEHVS